MEIHILFLHSMTIAFWISIVVKANEGKTEWLLLLIMLSYAKTCITYLFGATTIFTVVTIGEIQIHLDDIILIIALVNVIANIIYPFKSGKYLVSTLLLLIPTVISLFRGAIEGTLGSSEFLSDTRKFILFLAVFYLMYFGIRKSKAVGRLWKLEQYIDNLMNIVLFSMLVIWTLDRVFGVNSLPGQVGGTLSDGGSTFRIIGPSQALIIAFYTLYRIFIDLNYKKYLSMRTLLFVAIILLLQWRTVVAAFFAGTVVLFITLIREKGIYKKFFIEIIALCMIIIVMLTEGNNSNGLTGMLIHFFNSFTSIFRGTGSFSTRTNVWKMILHSLTGSSAIFGKPFGKSLEIAWSASAHSGYVDYIAKMGYLGMISLILFMIVLMFFSIKNKLFPITVILITLLVYWIGYGFSIEQGAILGTMLAILELKGNHYWSKKMYETNKDIYI